MSGPKKDEVKLSDQGIVTEEALSAYLQNKLNPAEKQQLEKLLQEDPFAQDALEGLQNSSSQSTVQASISNLNKKVRERSGLKERRRLKIHWVNYAWAAVVFGLLIGIGFIMVNSLNKKDNNLAVNGNKENMNTPVLTPKDTTAEYEKNKIVVSDSLAAKPITDTVKNLTGSAPPASAKPLSNEGKPLAENTVSPVPAKATQTVTTAASGASQKPAENMAFAKNKADTSKSAAAAAYKSVQPVINDNRDVATLQDDAMKSFNSGDYNTAAENFDKILKREPDNADALYFGGISDYINGKTAKSENNFDKLLKKGNKYLEGSKWYKANILIKKGHSEAAKPLLQDLSNSNGSYKERAIKKLAEMGF
jgi:tetratricopeptide (TPR) repeat protein